MAFLLIAAGLVASCEKPGDDAAWCESMKSTPQEQWSAEDAQRFAEKCGGLPAPQTDEGAAAETPSEPAAEESLPASDETPPAAGAEEEKTEETPPSEPAAEESLPAGDETPPAAGAEEEKTEETPPDGD
ncbi:MAG: DUF3012 domain-containing protein [Rhodothalassiaceae bacterium]